MQISFNITDINYTGISDNIYPFIKDKAEQYRASNPLLAMFMPTGDSLRNMISNMLGMFPQDMKDDALVEYVTGNNSEIAAALTSAAEKRGLDAKLSAITAAREGRAVGFTAELDSGAELTDADRKTLSEIISGFFKENLVETKLSEIQVK